MRITEAWVRQRVRYRPVGTTGDRDQLGEVRMVGEKFVFVLFDGDAAAKATLAADLTPVVQ